MNEPGPRAIACAIAILKDLTRAAKVLTICLIALKRTSVTILRLSMPG